MFTLAIGAGHAASVDLVSAAAEYLKRMGAFAPFASCPPVPAALVAGASAVAGGSEAAGYWVVAAAAWVAACWGARALAVERGAGGRNAWLTAATMLAVPSRVWMIFITPDLPRLIFWTLAVFMLLAFRAGRFTRIARLIGMGPLFVLAAGSHPAALSGFDFLAALEIAVVLSFVGHGATAFRREDSVVGGRGDSQSSTGLAGGLMRICFPWPLAAAAAVSISGLVWNFGVVPHYGDGPGEPPPELRDWLAEEAAGRRVFESNASLGLIARPGLFAAGEAIQSPGLPHESVLWLRALAVEYLVSADWLKYHSVLEIALESGAWTVYRLAAPNAAETVLVSLPVWKELPAIRGVKDQEAVLAYLDWSGRPEQAGIAWKSPREAAITADLGAFDAILVRRFTEPGWRAWVVEEGGKETEFPVDSDPLGFMVLAPDKRGAVTVRLRYEPGLLERVWPSPSGIPELTAGAFPAIAPNGVVDSTNFGPPPFPPGTLVSIFGSGFVDGDTRVRVGGKAVTPLYTGPNQVNFQLPESLPAGRVEIVVEAEGGLSAPVEIEVAGP